MAHFTSKYGELRLHTTGNYESFGEIECNRGRSYQDNVTETQAKISSSPL